MKLSRKVDINAYELKLLLERYKRTGDKRFRDQIVELGMPLVKFLAYKYARDKQDLDDLIQVGAIGLLKAIDRFDPRKGGDFRAYAIPTITGEIKKYFRDSKWLVKIPRRLKELKYKVDKMAQKLYVELGRSPTLSEIANALGVSREEVIEAVELSQSPVSLNILAHDAERPSELLQLIADQEKEFDKFKNLKDLEESLSKLPPMERYVIYMKFFYGLSQEEIAKKLNVSQMTISRLQNRALRKLYELCA